MLMFNPTKLLEKNEKLIINYKKKKIESELQNTFA